MKFFDIIEEAAALNDNEARKATSRREIIRDIKKFCSKAAIASLPFAADSLTEKAKADITDNVLSALYFMEDMEWLQYRFFRQGAELGPVPNGSDNDAIGNIWNDDYAHLHYFEVPVYNSHISHTPNYNNWDFTAKGAYPDVMTNYRTFLAVGQILKDTMVRIYKGWALTVLGDKTYLTDILDMHSVEARHAAHIREMRRNNGFIAIEPWITLANDSGVPSADAYYAGEDNTVQNGIEITQINGYNIDKAAASQAFDEPLTPDQAKQLMAPFYK